MPVISAQYVQEERKTVDQRLFRALRLSLSVAVEPGKRVPHFTDQSRRPTRNAMCRIWQSDHHRINSPKLERLIKLLGLRNRRAAIFLTGDQ